MEIADYLDILRSRARVQAIVKDELAAVKDEFATPRRTEIIEQEDEVEDEDLIQREDMVVTVSHAGYVKRVPLSAYRAQRRGGKGRSGMQTRDEDFVSRLFVASTHTPVLFFSSRGQVYKEKVWRLPMAAPNARGKALINILPLEQGERITTIMPLPEDESTWADLDVMFATTGGTVRRNKLSDFVDVRRSGIIAMKLDEGEAIVDVQICTEHDDVLLTAAGGQCIRFPVTDVRVFTGRTSMGVRGIALARGRQADLAVDPAPCRGDLGRALGVPENAPRGGRRSRGRRGRGDREPRRRPAPSSSSQERYVEMSAQEQVVLTVSVNGYGKRTSSFEYRTTGRGGKGIVAMSRQQPQRQAGGVVPGRGVRPDHAGDRQGPVDPLSGRGHPHRRPLDAGRHRVRHRRGRACGLGRAHRRGQRERQWQREWRVAPRIATRRYFLVAASKAVCCGARLSSLPAAMALRRSRMSVAASALDRPPNMIRCAASTAGSIPSRVRRPSSVICNAWARLSVRLACRTSKPFCTSRSTTPVMVVRS